MSVQSEEEDLSLGVDEVELEESDQKNHLDQHTNETLSDENNGTKQEQPLSEDTAYRHYQSPRWFMLIAAPVFSCIILFLVTNGSFSIAWTVILIGLIVGTLFWGLTVEVNKDIIRLAFGCGIIHRSIPRERIVTVTQVRNRWWYSLGIRLTPHGWMWNISGLDAVELTYHNGKKFRIGTDEPEALLEALKAV
ncbi:MAG: hypothetical protein VCF25_26230 [Candidatus Poribacteria bacterium]